MSEWQPIETAPKDGVPFRAYDAKEKRVFECFWEDPGFVRKWLVGVKPGWRENIGALGRYMTVGAWPTHWMPTPLPPGEA